MYKLITETEAENIPANFTGVAEHSNGYKEYLVNGLRHRDGGLPAFENSNGDKFYWVNGKRHRDGGLPAIEHSNGDKFYYVNGKRHRDGGLPAVEYSNGAKSYWVNGKQLIKDEAKHLAPSCNGKVVLIDGVEYKLTALNTP